MALITVISISFSWAANVDESEIRSGSCKDIDELLRREAADQIKAYIARNKCDYIMPQITDCLDAVRSLNKSRRINCRKLIGDYQANEQKNCENPSRLKVNYANLSVLSEIFKNICK